jgi:hypothetical protein
MVSKRASSSASRVGIRARSSARERRRARKRLLERPVPELEHVEHRRQRHEQPLEDLEAEMLDEPRVLPARDEDERTREPAARRERTERVGASRGGGDGRRERVAVPRRKRRRPAGGACQRLGVPDDREQAGERPRHADRASHTPPCPRRTSAPRRRSRGGARGNAAASARPRARASATRVAVSTTT